MTLLEETQENLIRHRCVLVWLQAQANNGQIQIAKSLLGTGYEIAIIPRKGNQTVKAYNGNLAECIEQAMGYSA